MRFFNTAGPVQEDIHYILPPLQRFDLPEVLQLINARKYFVLHAPRQTGKTTCLLALEDYLNQEGQYRTLYANIEGAQAAREDVTAGISGIVDHIAQRAKTTLGEQETPALAQTILERTHAVTALEIFLTEWCAQSPKPTVLLLDEVDALVGDTLISLLRQLRSGYDKRPHSFPQTIILCGVRDVRDYRIHSDQAKTIITGGSAFNIKAVSLRLGDFSRGEVEELFAQHTQETGQPFTPEALELVWDLTQGQPWLVNALGYAACFEKEGLRERSQPITAEIIHQAKERLILRRETHLDQLADKLREARVRRVIETLLTGEQPRENIPPDDINYVRDLGLIRTEGQITLANRIYQEIIPRELTYSEQLTLAQNPAWYIKTEGTLDFSKLLVAFQEFFREHSEHWLERFQYKEAGPQLLLQAFLQRVVNGGGRIEREYGLGLRRTDLLVLWPHSGGLQKVVLELKVMRGKPEKTIEEGLRQTADYMDRCGATEGHLLVFDRTQEKTWGEKLFHRTEFVGKNTISVWGV